LFNKEILFFNKDILFFAPNYAIPFSGYEGYAGDSSDSADECEWQQDLDMRRPSLPKFWLIMKVNREAVTTYFHCRYDTLKLFAVLMDSNLVSSKCLLFSGEVR
jgi:hypothetical protein